MELFISTSAKEKEVKTAFTTAIRKLCGYHLRAFDLHAAFDVHEPEVIDLEFTVQASKDAFCLIDFLYNDPSRFFDSLTTDLSDELFNYLLFNNRLSSMSYYLNPDKKVRLTIADEVFGERFFHEFRLKK